MNKDNSEDKRSGYIIGYELDRRNLEAYELSLKDEERIKKEYEKRNSDDVFILDEKDSGKSINIFSILILILVVSSIIVIALFDLGPIKLVIVFVLVICSLILAALDPFL